jgi:uncharacterized protein
MTWLSDMFTGRKQKVFLALFEQQCDILQRAARGLKHFCAIGDPALADEIDKIEKEGDELLTQIIAALNDAFITPFDRQDIYNLAIAIDDMIDYLNNTAREMKLFGVASTPAIVAIVGILENATDNICEAVSAMGSQPGLADALAVKAAAAENRVEDLYRQTLAELFNGNDMHQIFKLREIYRHLSNSADRAEAIARLIGKIVVKVA